MGTSKNFQYLFLSLLFKSLRQEGSAQVCMRSTLPFSELRLSRTFLFLEAPDLKHYTYKDFLQVF